MKIMEANKYSPVTLYIKILDYAKKNSYLLILLLFFLLLFITAHCKTTMDNMESRIIGARINGYLLYFKQTN